MENTELARQIVELNRTAAENAWNAFTLWQDQAERITRTVLESGHSIAAEGQRVVEEWVKEYKKGRTAARKTLESNYEQVQGLFAQGSRNPSKKSGANA